MNVEEITYFNLLKDKVVLKFTQENAVKSKNCSDWTGQEIELFKEDFIQKVKSGFSEKWFYTYFKNDVNKLPRIDMLNLLSAYAGYQNFADFKKKNEFLKEVPIELEVEEEAAAKVKYSKKRYYLFGLITLLVLGLSYLIYGFSRPTENSFSFCFIEKNNNQAPNTPLHITLLLDNESPLEFKTDQNSCFEYTTQSDQIKFVVQSPFHEPDTIVRNVQNQNEETISLRSNDYALMLQYYTNPNISNWKRKKEKLEKIISKDAVIYRVYPQSGISIYNKKEFINQLMIPTEDLKNLKILEADYKNNQIVKVKFIVSE